MQKQNLLKNIDYSNLPEHVAIIMDGNRRWAKKNGIPAIMGHRKGVESVKNIVRVANNIGIKVLTIYAFSTENWNRSKFEVNALMFLLKKVLRKYTAELKEKGIRLMVSGRINDMPSGIGKEIAESVEKLKDGKKLILNIALNYGGRQEIVDAVNRIIKSGIKRINLSSFNKFLYTFPLPDPDLLIRTSGELRISNFLLWQTAYSEFYVTDVFWPDFGEKEFADAIAEYQKRDRRFGKK
ncbi:MAG: isoprenyl transferase [Elusimicrobia bacterium]|nr:isoprenyl transferase [Elusimicrobiota bacterium]